MDSLHGSSRWHGAVDGGDWEEDRPHKRLRTSKSHASILQPVARLVRTPFDTLGSIAEALGYGSDSGRVRGRLPAEEQERHLQLLRLRGAKTCEEWKTAAFELDRLEGGDQWRDKDESEEYDFELVRTRLERLQDARKRGDVEDMRFQIRTALTRDLGGMGNARLYKHSRNGTKSLIERYMDTVIDVIDTVITSSGLEARPVLEQVTFARQAFGRSALLLSGGGTLGMNHIGVVKALFEADMLPRIISGASAGSIVCSVLCTKTDDEIPQVLQDFCHGELDVFEPHDETYSLVRRVARFFMTGTIFDVENLTRVMKNLLGNLTFLEAYNKTQRILSICVSSAGVYEMPRLLNYVTAPHVLIWSAVAASCSVPLVFSAAELQVKDPNTGVIKNWNEDTSKWIDGSVDNDLPMTRLAEMLNVNHFIVSQVNPHVVPFLVKGGDEIAPDIPRSSSALAPGPSWLHTVANLAKGEALHRMHVLAELGIFPNTMTKFRSVLGQRYSGDITIIPEISYTQFPNILENPTSDFMAHAMFNGERATWPKLSRIRNHLAIELKLDEAVTRLRARVAFSPSQVDLRMNVFARPNMSSCSDRGRSRRGSKGSHKSARSAVVSRQVPGRQGGHRPIKSMLDAPSTMPSVPATKVAGPSLTDYFSSAEESRSPRSTSPSVLSDDDDDDYDDDSVVSDTSELPPSPQPDLWPSTRQLFPSASQPVTPSQAYRSSASASPTVTRPSTPATASLTMTPSSRPSSPEAKYKNLFHGVRHHLPGRRSQASTPPETGEQPPRQGKKLGGLGLQLDMSGTRGMVRRKKRSNSTGLEGLKPPNKQ